MLDIHHDFMNERSNASLLSLRLKSPSTLRPRANMAHWHLMPNEAGIIQSKSRPCVRSTVQAFAKDAYAKARGEKMAAAIVANGNANDSSAILF